MAFPAPLPALVIRYSYLWHSEFVSGSEEGMKDRPCAIITAIKTDNGVQKVLVLPVTHSAPDSPENAIEIPQETKERLGLDSERSWVVLTEWNEFSWPGPDLRMVVSVSGEKTVAYGYLPAKFFAKVCAAFVAMAQKGSARKVKRSE
jgi:hypothetical protein